MKQHARISLPALACILLGGLALAAAAHKPETVLFEETFHGKLGDGWAWVRETPGAWKVNKGELVLTVQPGYLHAKYNDARNVLLRDPPGELGATWAVELMLDSAPEKQFEHAGVLIYWDDDNYVSLFRENMESRPKLQMVAEKEAHPTFAVVDKDIKPVWLRLVVSGEDVTSQYRATEKDAWQTVGTKKRPSAGKFHCGLTSGGAAKDAAHDAKFSHFRILRLGAE
jgi:regulation of enolase protein 1 (concanavalin A-like superfamily)